VLALLAVWAAACSAGNQSAASSPTPAAQAAPAKPAATSPTPAANAGAVLPKSCGERVTAAAVSTAIGKTLTLTKEVPAERGLLCYYDLQGSSPSPLGYVGRVTYTELDHNPTRQEVNDYFTTVNKNAGAAKFEETTGLGDYSGWATITISSLNSTAWVVIATRGKLMVDFITSSLYTEGDRAKLSEVVRKALG
jgi:hypothetical protein